MLRNGEMTEGLSPQPPSFAHLRRSARKRWRCGACAHHRIDVSASTAEGLGRSQPTGSPSSDSTTAVRRTAPPQMEGLPNTRLVSAVTAGARLCTEGDPND